MTAFPLLHLRNGSRHTCSSFWLHKNFSGDSNSKFDDEFEDQNSSGGEADSDSNDSMQTQRSPVQPQVSYKFMYIHIILIFVSQINLPSEGPALAQLSASNRSFNFSRFLPHEIWATTWAPSATDFPTFTIDNLATAIYDAVHASTDLSVNGPSMTDLVRAFEGLIDQCLAAGDCTKLLASNRHFEV